MNKTFASRNNKHHFYLLRGLLVCAICERTLIGSCSAGTVRYQCPSRGKNRPPDVSPHSISISGSVIEPLVWQAVSDLLRNPKLLEDAWQNQVESTQASPGEMDRLQSHLRRLERQWTRLLDAFQSEVLDKDELVKRKEHLDQARQTLEHRLEQLTRQERQDRAKEQMLEDFASFCQQIERSLDKPTPQVQQEVIRLLIDHIVVDKDAIVIKHIIPTDDDCRLLPGHRCTQIYADKRQKHLCLSVSHLWFRSVPKNSNRRWDADERGYDDT